MTTMIYSDSLGWGRKLIASSPTWHTFRLHFLFRFLMTFFDRCQTSSPWRIAGSFFFIWARMEILPSVVILYSLPPKSTFALLSSSTKVSFSAIVDEVVVDVCLLVWYATRPDACKLIDKLGHWKQNAFKKFIYDIVYQGKLHHGYCPVLLYFGLHESSHIKAMYVYICDVLELFVQYWHGTGVNNSDLIVFCIGFI